METEMMTIEDRFENLHSQVMELTEKYNNIF